MNHTYRIIIEPDTKGFHGYVPSLKGCHTWGKTIPETKKHLQEAVGVYLESLMENGKSIPEEQSFESFTTVFVEKAKQRSKIQQREYA
ncbi:type II toxin-antitoxin system HicB family antitoxin [Candidatus Uhrbacteria bacterium]|nr:type II toxin-antitoxin system HicB family antitoxin [Candidatus Uhrbacteria bacterium]